MKKAVFKYSPYFICFDKNEYKIALTKLCVFLQTNQKRKIAFNFAFCDLDRTGKKAHSFAKKSAD